MKKTIRGINKNRKRKSKCVWIGNKKFDVSKTLKIFEIIDAIDLFLDKSQDNG